MTSPEPRGSANGSSGLCGAADGSSTCRYSPCLPAVIRHPASSAFLPGCAIVAWSSTATAWDRCPASRIRLYRSLRRVGVPGLARKAEIAMKIARKIGLAARLASVFSPSDPVHPKYPTSPQSCSFTAPASKPPTKPRSEKLARLLASFDQRSRPADALLLTGQRTVKQDRASPRLARHAGRPAWRSTSIPRILSS